MELLNSKKQDREVGIDSKTGFLVIAKAGRFGPYVQLQDPDPDSKAKAKTASLFSDMSIETITLQDALELLELPRVVGEDPESKEEIIAQNGRFGPYLTKGKDSRSLTDERSLFTVTIEEALELFSKPKENRRQRSQAQPANILGVSPVTEKDVSLKAGRFGPYVTDGSVNASIPRGTNPETLTLEAALDLLEIRRAKLAETADDEKPKARRTTTRSGTKRTTTKRRT
jgi:DNA topoisomerase-1